MIMCCCFDVEKSYFLHKNVVIEPQTISNCKNLTRTRLSTKKQVNFALNRKPPEMAVLYGSYQDEVFP